MRLCKLHSWVLLLASVACTPVRERASPAQVPPSLEGLIPGASLEAEAPCATRAFARTGYPMPPIRFDVDVCPLHQAALVEVESSGYSGCYGKSPSGYREAREQLFPYARGTLSSSGGNPSEWAPVVNRCEACSEAELLWLGEQC